MLAPNWIDRAIEYVSPQRAVKRSEARSRIARSEKTKALFEAAGIGRRTQGWRAVGSDANAETRVAMGRLRDVARDMVRNNAYAARAKATIAHNVVGEGIEYQVRAGRPERVEQVKKLLKSHLNSTDIDADGRHNLYGLQQLAMGTVVEAGEILIRMRPRRPTDGFDLPFQIQLLEPDFLDTMVDGQQSNGNYAVQGIEFNGFGQRVAYYLFDEHPGSTTPNVSVRTRGKRISADFVAHVYRVDRPGQVRGVSWFAPVLLRMRDFADYCDAQLMRQKIAACFAAFITQDELPDNVDTNAVSAAGNPIETFEPGMIERLRAGESVSFATPPSTQDFGPYSSATLHEIAAGLNVTHEALTGNLEGVNFSSGRMGWLEYHRSISSWRWNMLIPQMLDPFALWGQQAVNVASGSSEPFWLDWTPPRREMIDPDSELAGATRAIRAGLSSRPEELRKLGLDPDVIYQEIKEDNARADRDGLIFDSDPRHMTMNGIFQRSQTAPESRSN
jgi:lambda family phage portal protein